MFEYPRQLRLLKPGDFRFVFNKAEMKAGHPAFLMLARSNNLDHARIGFVVAKKNVRLACGRNRAKRIIREEFRLMQHRLPAFDIVVIARKPLTDIDSQDLHRGVAKSLAKLSRQYEEFVSRNNSPAS